MRAFLSLLLLLLLFSNAPWIRLTMSMGRHVRPSHATCLCLWKHNGYAASVQCHARCPLPLPPPLCVPLLQLVSYSASRIEDFPEQDLTNASCEHNAGTVTMTFTRPLQASTADQTTISLDQQQGIIWSYGASVDFARHRVRDNAFLMVSDGIAAAESTAAAPTATPAAVPQSGTNAAAAVAPFAAAATGVLAVITALVL